jgi:hypothetical protein
MYGKFSGLKDYAFDSARTFYGNVRKSDLKKTIREWPGNASASFLFWTAPFIPIDFIAGKDEGDIFYTRLIAAPIAHFTVAHFVQPAREAFRESSGLYSDCSWLERQLKVNLPATVLTQPATYGLVLGIAEGVRSLAEGRPFSMDTSQTLLGMAVGLGVSMAFMPIYLDWYMDKIWGKKDKTFPDRPSPAKDDLRLREPKGGLEKKVDEMAEL